jgi:hypothetical protein
MAIVYDKFTKQLELIMNKTITLGADSVHQEIDCGQIMCKLSGVDTESICRCITAQDAAEYISHADLLDAIVFLRGADWVKSKLEEIE